MVFCFFYQHIQKLFLWAYYNIHLHSSLLPWTTAYIRFIYHTYPNLSMWLLLSSGFIHFFFIIHEVHNTYCWWMILHSNLTTNGAAVISSYALYWYQNSIAIPRIVLSSTKWGNMQNSFTIQRLQASRSSRLSPRVVFMATNERHGYYYKRPCLCSKRFIKADAQNEIWHN